ncbi:hypothetical protein ABIB26_003471 [Arthrobacter sp. UYEF20]
MSDRLWTQPSPGAHPYYKSAPGTGAARSPGGTPVLAPGEVFSPVMVLKESALEHNLVAMAKYCTDHGVDIACTARPPSHRN